MGILLQPKTQERLSLATRNLAGRGSLAQIVINHGTVSAEHASLYFDGAAWKLRDLGSRNGTKVNGERLSDGESKVLAPHDALAFGGAEESWILEDASAPGPSALLGGQAGGERVNGDEGMLWLPDDEQALASVSYREGGWIFENGEQERAVKHGHEVLVAGGRWELELPQWDPRDSGTGLFTTMHHVDSPQLQFTVSHDYEHIELTAEWRGRRYELGARAHNLPLLLLSKNRLADRANGLGKSEEGWMYVDALMKQSGLDRKSLNLQLWRSVRSAKRSGFATQSFVERRVDAGQLRIVSGDLTIAYL